MPHDGFGVELRHPRRADHHGRRASGLRARGCIRCTSACPPPCPGHDADAAVTWLVTASSTRCRSVLQARDFAGHAEHRHAIDARPDEQVDDAPEALLVDVTLRVNGVGRTEYTPSSCARFPISWCVGPRPMRSRSASPRLAARAAGPYFNAHEPHWGPPSALSLGVSAPRSGPRRFLNAHGSTGAHPHALSLGALRASLGRRRAS